jgi:Tol biopolymer transport system component
MDEPRRSTPLHAWIIAFATVLWCGAARGQQDPAWRWYTIETDHFRVYYYEDLEDVARRSAAIAEEAHRRLAAELGWEPRRITHLVVMDETDYAQGVTFVGARNLIRIWAVGPEDGSVLEDFDDWLNLLITHEYTHLVHLDQTHGFPRIINAIFGEIYHPVQVSPSFLLEGYAVYEESNLTTGGRVRSSMFDMYLRMAVLEDRFLRIDQVATATQEFPQGNVPYLYGQGFVAYLARRFGDQALARLAREMSDDVIPYGINRAFHRVTGHTLVELWDDWHRSLETGYRALAERLGEEGLTETRPLTDTGERVGPPRFGPDGRLVYYHQSTEASPSAIWTVDVESGRRRRVTLTAGTAVVAASSDGRYLYYSRSDRHEVVYRYLDLFRFDLSSGEEERLTDGARATAVDISPDGRQVVYTANRDRSSDLWIADAELSERRCLVRSEPGDQVYSPRFSPDGRHVVVSRWLRGGYRDIQVVSIDDGSVRPIAHDRHLSSGPCFTPDSRWVVFSSDRTGIANLYAYDLRQDRIWQITNVVSGAYQPDVSPDGRQIVFVGFSSRGFDLHIVPFDVDSFREPQPAREREDRTDEIPEPRMRVRRYRPWATLVPRSWMLGYGQDSFGDALTLTVNGEDATAAHRIAGVMTIGLERGDVSWDLSYELAALRPNFTLRFSRWTAPRSTFRVDTSSEVFIEENYLVSLDMSIWLGRGNHSHRLWGGYEYHHSRSLTDLGQASWDPAGRPPRYPDLGNRSSVRLGWTFSNARSSVRAVSLEQGRTLSVSLGVAHPALGSDYSQVTFRYRWSEYITMPWRHHHVLALSLGGGISAGGLRASSFYLGGYPEQDWLAAVMDQAFMGSYYLRGYPPGVIGGAQYHMLNMEYRLPLWNVERGISTLPVFLSHFWMAVFCDVGGAFDDDLDFADLLVGVGGEILVRVIVGYYLPITLRIGYARGLMDGGDDQFFAVAGVPF